MFQIVMTIFLMKATLTYKFPDYYDHATCVEMTKEMVKHWKPNKKYKKASAELSCEKATDRRV